MHDMRVLSSNSSDVTHVSSSTALPVVIALPAVHGQGETGLVSEKTVGRAMVVTHKERQTERVTLTFKYNNIGRRHGS